jgi:hypothetical protein
MGGVLSYLRPIPAEQRDFIHNVYIRAPAVEMTYDTMREMDKGHGFYPTQISFSISRGHATWDGLLNRVFLSYKIDPEKVKDMFWAVWVTKHVPTFDEDSGEQYTARSKIINDFTDSKILAGYIIDVEWEFYFSLENHSSAGVFNNSPTPSFSSYLRPTEDELLPNKREGDSV